MSSASRSAAREIWASSMRFCTMMCALTSITPGPALAAAGRQCRLEWRFRGTVDLMVTPGLAPTRPRRRLQLALKILGGLMVLLFVAAIAVGAWFYRAARAALPQMEGRIQVSGLRAPVTVVRDAQGVPHITAANLDDLFF